MPEHAPPEATTWPLVAHFPNGMRPGRDGAIYIPRVDSIAGIFAEVTTDLTLRDRTDRARAVLDRSVAEPTNVKPDEEEAAQLQVQYDRLKKGLSTIIPGLAGPVGAPVKAAPPSTPLYVLDLDKHEPSATDGVWAELVRHPHVVMAGRSCSHPHTGGFWAIVHGPQVDTDAEYKAEQAHILECLSPLLRASAATGQHNANRARFMPFDPEAFLAAGGMPPAHPPAPTPAPQPPGGPPPTPPDARNQAPGPASDRNSSRRRSVEDSPAKLAADIALVPSAMAFLTCPVETKSTDKHNLWLQDIRNLAEVGWSESSIAEWCARGSGRTCGSLDRVRDGLNQRVSTTPREAVDSLLGQAYKAGWRRPDKTASDGRKARKPESAQDVHSAAVDPDSPELLAGLALTSENAQTAANAARFAAHHASDLLIALDRTQVDDKADVYAVTASGRIDQLSAKSLLHETAYHLLEQNRLLNCFVNESGRLSFRSDFKVVQDDARSLLQPDGWDRVRRIMPSVIVGMERKGSMPVGLVVVDKDKVDSNMRYIGAENGVWDLLTGLVVDPQEARHYFVSASIPDAVDTGASHPMVDQILPPVDSLEDESVELHRAQVLAFTMTHIPQREFVLELCDAGSGKSTFRNALQYGLKPYVGGIAPDAIMTGRYATVGATAYNGHLFRLAAPARIRFMAEFGSKAGNVDIELLNKITGGEASLEVRQIRGVDTTIAVTATLWVQGNRPRDGVDPLGLANEGDDADAVRDRCRVLHRDRIAPADQDPGFKAEGLENAAFRQAVVARVMEYTARWGADGFPDDIEAERAYFDRLVAEAAPRWKREWLPWVMVEDDENAHSVASSLDVYESYQAWHAASDEGKPVSQRMITDAVQKWYQVQGRTGQLSKGGKRTRVQFFDGWTLAEG